MKVREHFIARIGGNEYADTPHLLAAKDKPLLTLRRDDESGELDVSLDIYDDSGRERARIRHSELRKGSRKAFDILETGNQFTVIDREHDRVVCDIRRRARARDMDIDVSLLLHTPDGFLVHANPDQTNLKLRASEEILRQRDAALVAAA